MPTPQSIVRFLFIAWVISWIVAAKWSAQAEKRAARQRHLAPYFFLVTGFVILFGIRRDFLPSGLRWRVEPAVGWGMVALALFGLAFTWWARIHLGRLWSSGVTIKADHRIVDTGPYGLVRHPIYTGLLCAIAAAAVIDGTALGLLGAVLVTFGLYLKARLEERFLREQLGAREYDAYARRVPMLLPFPI